MRLLAVAVGGDPGEADDLGEVLAAACGWETWGLETGLALVRGAVQRARLARDEAVEEMAIL